MTKTQAKKIAQSLLKKAPTAVLTSIDGNGFPSCRAMLNLKSNTLKTVWFTTNAPSEKVAQFRANAKAAVYFTVPGRFEGALLKGKVKIITDMKVKKKLWEPGWKMYYPEGVTDQNYCVLRFDAAGGRVYSNFTKTDF